MIDGGDQRRRDGFDRRGRLQVDWRKRRRGKQLEMLTHVVSSASGSSHQCKESCRCEETLSYQMPACLLTCSRHCFHCINLLSLELWGQNIFAPFLLKQPG